MAKDGLTQRLYLFLWHRYLDGLDATQAAEKAGITEDEFLTHRAARTRFYCAAEARAVEGLPDEMMERYARLAQGRFLFGTARDSATAGVAARVLDARAENAGPTTITFIIQDAETAEKIEEVARAAVAHSREDDTPPQAQDVPDITPESARAAARRAPHGDGSTHSPQPFLWPEAAPVAIAKSHKPSKRTE